MTRKVKLIKNGTLILPDRDEPVVGDLQIAGGKIAKVELRDGRRRGSDGSAKGAEVIDAKGLMVLPGLIDMHVHLREPGEEGSETIASGTAAAAAGGITAVACMPNTYPPTDNQESVLFIKQRAANCPARVYPIGAITKGREGTEIAEIGEMIEIGAVAISDDGTPVKDAVMMRRALEYAGMFDIPVISHSEDLSLAGDGVMHEGYESTRLGMAGIPAVAEEVCVARDLILAKCVGTHLHIAHVSTKGAVELIRQAKREGVRVTAEATPHHFSLTDKLIGEEFDTNLKMNPPLRTREDIDAIIAGLADGTIDCIASDHAPHSTESKDVEFDQAPNGIVGLETIVGLAITNLVRKGHLTWNDLARKMSQ
ncbi:MAG: dihydroorotase, partial [bacterium]